MALSDRVKKAWQALFSPEPPARTTDTNTNLRRTYKGYFPWMQIRNDRKVVEEVIERMDEEDEIVSAALDAIADCATTFTDPGEDREILVESEDSRVQGVLDDMFERTGIYYKTWDITRTAVEKGNHFCQAVIGPDMNVSALKQFPFSYQIVKNVDDGGNLLQGDPRQAMKKDETGVAPYDQIIQQNLVAAFYEFQILHFMYGATKGMVYAKPILQSAIRNWKRLQAAEDSVAVARILRAYNQLVHHVPMPMEMPQDERIENIKTYKKMMQRQEVADWDSTNSYTKWDSVPDPQSVATDIYVPRLFDQQGNAIDGDVKSIGGTNPHITNLQDLDRSLNRILCVLKVPAKILNYDTGQRHFVDTGDKERDEQFGRTLRRVQKAVKQPYYTLCDLELALNGINPETVDYTLIMPPIAVRAEERVAQIENQRGQTASFWRSAGVPNPMIWDKVLRFTDEEIEAAQQMQAARQAMIGDLEDEESGEDNPFGQE